MKLLLLALLGLASAFGFAPGAMPMQLQRSQASVTLSPQMKALNKPARLAEVRRKYNKNHKSEMRTYIKKLMVACESGEYATASPLLNKVQSCIDKNVKRGLMHKNTAARKKSQLTFKVKALEPGAKAPEPVAA